MAIKVSGTEVVSNSRELKNIATVDSGTVSVLNAALDTDPTKGTLTKSFASGETASITLAQAISPAPVVSATKEVAQAGISSKGAWDVNATASNYELHNTAYSTTLTPGSVVGDIEDGTLTDTFYTQGFSAANINSFFNDDGTRLYVYGYTNRSLSSFPLSTAYDISTRGSELQSVTIANLGGGGSFGPRWNDDGTKLYYPTLTGYIYELAVSTAYDLSTIATSSTSTLNLSSYITGQAAGIVFKPDGTRLWLINDVSPLAIAIECTLSTAWDLSTASYTTQTTLDAPATAIAFADNGSTMYVLDRNADLIYRFNLSTAYDLSTFDFAGSQDNINLGSGVGDPCNITIDNDDKVLLVANFGNSNTYQYSATVTNALTLGSGSFASTDVGKRIQGNGGDVTLTSTAGAYDTTGGSAFTDSSAIASGSWTMRGLKSAGDADGLKITGNLAVNAVYASTFRVANYADVFNASSDLATPIGLHMARDGSHLYACSQNGNLIVYSMSPSFLPSTASYQGSYNSVGSTGKWDVEFNETGTRMFVQDIVSSAESVKVFSLSVPWRPDTGTVTLLSTYNLGVSETDSTPTTGGSIQFSNNGRSFYYHPYGEKSGNSSEGPSQKAGQSYGVPTNSGVVYYWTLSTAYDLSSKTYQGYKRVPHSSYPSFGVTEDGKWLINGAYNTNDVVYYAIQTAWDITSINSADEVYINHGNYASSSSSAGQIASSWVGDNYYTIDYTNKLIQKFPWGPALTTAAAPGYIPGGYQIATTNSGGQIDSSTWVDINSMTADQTAGDGTVHYAVSTDDRTTWSVAKASDGVRPIVRDNAGTWQYNSDNVTSSSFAISGATYSGDAATFATNGEDTQSYTVAVKPDGTKLYVAASNSDRVYQYDLSTAFDLSTASYNSVYFLFGSQLTNPRDIQFKPDGTEVYLNDYSGVIYQYTMSTAWDLTTALYSGYSFDTPITNNTYGIFFKPDGTKLYISDNGSTDQLIYEHTLTTPWRVDTASYDSKYLNARTQMSNILTSFAINPTGTKVHAYDYGSETLYEYDLSTAWDMSTASYNNVSVSLNPSATYDGPSTIHLDYTVGKLYAMRSERLFEWTGLVTSTLPYSTTATWANATTNDEFYALQQALSLTNNRMDKTQLDAVADGSHFTLGDTLDLAIALRMDTASASTPKSDGVSINYDAQALNQGAVLGTDYDYDFPDSTTVRITSNAAQNLKIRVV